MTQLGGKVAAITGAGSGIGRALALALAKEGCDLALSDVNEAGLQETRDHEAPVAADHVVEHQKAEHAGGDAVPEDERDVERLPRVERVARLRRPVEEEAGDERDEPDHAGEEPHHLELVQARQDVLVNVRC